MLSPPRPSWQPAPFRRSVASKVRLASRGPLDRLDTGPNFIRGAHEIVSMITSRRTVTKLILNHNALGDDGCVVLFKFLCSDVGRSTNISEIWLPKNGIGDRGLLAISEYLSGNKSLKELYLQSNIFQGTPSVVSAFIAALNSSRLEKLILSSNTQLSDSFLATFLPSLDAPHLQDLALSLVGLTFLSVPHLTSYISSSRCRLRNLSLNGNALGLSGVTDLIRTIKDCNFGLQKVELYSNQVGEPGHAEAWKNNELELKRLLMRNQHLKKQTEKEALALLVAARASLLPSTKSQSRCEAQTHLSLRSDIRQVPASLPIELQLYILSFLTPNLSSAQRIHIYTYASIPDTLPALLPRLPSTNNRRSPPGPPRPGAMSRSSTTGCLDGCIRGVMCQKEQERERWLKVVGCDNYERELEGGIAV